MEIESTKVRVIHYYFLSVVCEKDYNQYNEKKTLDGMTKAH